MLDIVTSFFCALWSASNSCDVICFFCFTSRYFICVLSLAMCVCLCVSLCACVSVCLCVYVCLSLCVVLVAVLTPVFRVWCAWNEAAQSQKEHSRIDFACDGCSTFSFDMFLVTCFIYWKACWFATMPLPKTQSSAARTSLARIECTKVFFCLCNHWVVDNLASDSQKCQ